MPLRELEDGDIILTVSDASFIFHNDPVDLAYCTHHGLIYSDTNGERSVIHAQQGSYQSGVKSMLINNYIKPNEEILLGKHFVLRCMDKETKSNITEVANKWAPKISREESERRLKEFNGRLPTPIGVRYDFFERRRSKEHQENISIYRVIRAFIRNHRQHIEPHSNLHLNAVPLSKNKGVMCSDFVSYTYRVALLKKYFSKGLPIEILAAYDEIECDKTVNQLKKTSDLPMTKLEKLAELIRSNLSPNVYQQLCIPVKGKGIKFFTDTALQQKDNWQFVGFLSYVEEIPTIIDYELYAALQGKTVGEGEAQQATHSIIVNQEEIDLILNKNGTESKTTESEFVAYKVNP